MCSAFHCAGVRQAHSLVPMLTNPSLRFPYLVVLVSGGHSLIVAVKDAVTFVRVGGTLDDSLGGTLWSLGPAFTRYLSCVLLLSIGPAFTCYLLSLHSCAVAFVKCSCVPWRACGHVRASIHAQRSDERDCVAIKLQARQTAGLQGTLRGYSF